MDWNYQLSELNYDDQEKNVVNRVIKSEWLTMGKECQSFEREFADYIGHQEDGIFVSSATAALHLILMAIKLSHGDEVIMPGLTFVSDANVVRQLGAIPKFADSISLNDLNVSVASIVEQITKNTKAIIIVHFAGFPMELGELKSICDEKGIFLIEDCAHAPGASINGRKCGTIGNFSFFSFFSNKNLAIGEGGMAFANSTEHAKKIRLMRSHGMTALTLDRHQGRASTYDISTIGLNYRPDEMRGALGRTQLKKLSAGNLKRASLHKSYSEALTNTNIIVPFEKKLENGNATYHIMPVILPEEINRDEIINGLKAKGIQTSIHYPNFRNFTAYQNSLDKYPTPMVDQICNRELTLPLHPRLKTSDVCKIANTLIEVLNNA